MIRRPPRSTLDRSSAASDVYKRQRLSLRGRVLDAGPVRRTSFMLVLQPHAHPARGDLYRILAFGRALLTKNLGGRRTGLWPGDTRCSERGFWVEVACSRFNFDGSTESELLRCRRRRGRVSASCRAASEPSGQKCACTRTWKIFGACSFGALFTTASSTIT